MRIKNTPIHPYSSTSRSSSRSSSPRASDHPPKTRVTKGMKTKAAGRTTMTRRMRMSTCPRLTPPSTPRTVRHFAHYAAIISASFGGDPKVQYVKPFCSDHGHPTHTHTLKICKALEITLINVDPCVTCHACNHRSEAGKCTVRGFSSDADAAPTHKQRRRSIEVTPAMRLHVKFGIGCWSLSIMSPDDVRRYITLTDCGATTATPHDLFVVHGSI